jgi:fatty acid desaturase
MNAQEADARSHRHSSRLRQLKEKHWQPKPVQPPRVDPELEKLTGPQRSAEVIRYSILSIEFWLSPLGRLREWVRLNGKLGAVLLIPALLVIPVVTFILWHIAQWMTMLLGIAGGLIVLPLAALLAAVVLTITVIIVRALLGK